jgi:hypothetical protein
MNSTELGKATSSRSRLQILDLLSRRPMSMETLLKGAIGKGHVDQTKCVVHNDSYREYVIRVAR